LASAGNPFFWSTATFENPDESNLDVQIWLSAAQCLLSGIGVALLTFV